ncbi:MAG: hypothetical protein ACI4EV_03275 [Lachnospiraceae bacterium]
MRKLGAFAAVVGLLAAVAVGCGEKAEGDIIDIQLPSETYAALEKSEAGRFNMEDLVVENVKAMMPEADVKNGLGNPIAERTSEDGSEKILFYDQMTITLTKLEGNYVLTGVRVTGGSWKVARELKVGGTRDDVLKYFYRDEQCLNNNFMSLDNETILGKFLYGDFTLENLEKYSGSGAVEYGIINYNGYADMETAQSLTYQYVYMEDSFIGKKPSQDDDFAQLNVEVDGNGVITEISWYYYEEIK